MYLLGKKRAVVFVLVGVLLAGGVYCGLLRNAAGERHVAAQNKTSETIESKMENADANRANLIYGNLKTLLANKEVVFDESKILPNQAKTSKTIRVQFQSAEKNSGENKFSDEKPKLNLLKLAALKNTDQPLTRQRAFELSATQILTVAADENKNVLWWNLQPDPRLFRAETADENGNLSGKTIYLNEAEMLVSVPDDKAISGLYFYSPIRTENSFNLELIGSLNLTAANSSK